MTLQNIVNGAQNIRKSRRAQIDHTRTQGGRVFYQRSGPFITTFEVTPGYPTHAEVDNFSAQYQSSLVGPYDVSFKSETVRTNGSYNSTDDTLVVRGGGQTDRTLNVGGLRPNMTDILMAGDVIKITGVNLTYVLVSDASSTSTGTAILTLDQPPQTAPADGSAIAVGADISWRLFLEQVPDDLGLGRVPGFGSYGGTFILREGF